MCTLWWHKTSIIRPADKRPLPSSVLPLCLFFLICSLHQTARLREKPFPLRSSDWSGYLMFLFLLCKNIVDASVRANLSYDLDLSMAYDTIKAIKNTFLVFGKSSVYHLPSQRQLEELGDIIWAFWHLQSCGSESRNPESWMRCLLVHISLGANAVLSKTPVGVWLLWGCHFCC